LGRRPVSRSHLASDKIPSPPTGKNQPFQMNTTKELNNNLNAVMGIK